MSKTMDELVSKLKGIRNDKDFVVGVVSNAKTEENFKKLIDFIDAEENVTAYNLIALSVLLPMGIDTFATTPGGDKFGNRE